ncbi:MAG: glycine--tRNA ligase subunit beta, partial [Candidatus Promineifilaceae bacterium]
TMNPATSLRVLGPEPWNVVYVEPSIRPDDGRFGDNPNRMQMHFQLQVILKPDPGNPQEIYIKSLEAIGFNQREHDIRFVEDNWESPALGAWGLGWEVWLDGQEITQFTYFQQAGGLELEPNSVEITYGLDRIALALQGKEAVWDIDFGAGVGYGDVLLPAEIEHCEYYFNVADVDALTTIYDTYEKEAERCLDAGLIVPAHDYNLKCSHLFNVLDTRGAVGVTERANYFQRMRRIARQVSEAYVEQRQRLEYPFFDVPGWQKKTEGTTALKPTRTPYERPQTFVLEIGSEELPPDDLTSAVRQLRVTVPEFLENLRLDYERITVDGTPRRLSVIVDALQPRQEDLETVVTGPPADRAFDADGKPTKAAEGFARSRGVSVEDLEVLEEKGRRYVMAVVHEEGRPAGEILSENLAELVASIKFEKSMRWNDSNVSYSRPLRWLLALYGVDIVPFSYAGVASGRTSRGLRPYDSPSIEVDDAASYAALMRDNKIILNSDVRSQTILEGVTALAAEKSGTIPDDQGLLGEVTNLVEYPTPLLGEFEKRFLSLPEEVLVAVMRKHQRYFPVYGNNGRLLPYFIAVRNGDGEHLDIVREGNEHVIRARFADAEFFYTNDVKKKLADFLPELDKLTFQADLGSILAKTRRLENLVPEVAVMLGLDGKDLDAAARAAALAKADLATSMVVEMTALQGIMGGHYAGLSGEEEAAIKAIAEQYNAVSQTKPGLALALADRFDSLLGLFAAGLAPKGSNDPFALRRAAIQIIDNLVANEQFFDLNAGLAAAAPLLPVQAGEAEIADVLEFIDGRLGVVLRENGFASSVIKAVVAEAGHDPYLAWRNAFELSQAIEAEDWQDVLNAYARCVRITRNLNEEYDLNPAALNEPAEKALWSAYEEAAATADGTMPTLIESLRGMVPAISRFFEDILVMDDDPAVRQNRLALLQNVAGLTKDMADFSQLEGF